MIGPHIIKVLLLYQVFFLHTGNDKTSHYRGPSIVSSVSTVLYTGNDRTIQYRGPSIVSSVPITYR